MRPVEAKHPLEPHIARLREQIANYRTKAERTRKSISRIIGAMTQLPDRKAIFKEFNNDLDSIELRLDQRFRDLLAAENLLKQFRQTPDQPRAVTRTGASAPSERQRMLSENQRLIEVALGNERLTLILKMKLRLCHDHRDAARLRRVLTRLEGGGGDYNEDDDVVVARKIAIGNLRRAIDRERERIAALSNPLMAEHEAATVIQKTWRGFWHRLINRAEVEEEAAEAPPAAETPPGQEEAPQREERPGDAPAAASQPE
jgi:hypothetical protein